jgi:hypothetical protein
MELSFSFKVRSVYLFDGFSSKIIEVNSPSNVMRDDNKYSTVVTGTYGM